MKIITGIFFVVVSFRVGNLYELMILSMGSLEQVTSKLNIHSTLYSIKGADKQTMLTSDVEAINIPLSLFHANSVLLTTPSEPQVRSLLPQ